MDPATHRRTWLQLLAGGAVAAAVAGALLAGWRLGAHTSDARAGATQVSKIDLGRAMCGECCTGRVWRAVGSLPGVADVVAKAGESSIVVHHDGRAGVQHELVQHLVAADFPEANLLAEPTAAVPPPRQWIRPVQRPSAPPRN